MNACPPASLLGGVLLGDGVSRGCFSGNQVHDVASFHAYSFPSSSAPCICIPALQAQLVCAAQCEPPRFHQAQLIRGDAPSWCAQVAAHQRGFEDTEYNIEAVIGKARSHSTTSKCEMYQENKIKLTFDPTWMVACSTTSLPPPVAVEHALPYPPEPPARLQ